MQVIIYESASFGGCYDYSLQLAQAYQRNAYVANVQLLLPKIAKTNLPQAKKILLADKLTTQSKWKKKLHFLWRNFINPLLLLRFLQQQPPAFVLLNDFEQLTALFWVPLYKLLFKKHTFGIFLHDPDRDAYPPSTEFSVKCMKSIMSLMTVGLYHEHLPQKPYYQTNGKTTYLSVPHGLYSLPKPDTQLLQQLNSQKQGKIYAAIVGNIRLEKNYHLVIPVLSYFPQLQLIIAGSPASSDVDITALKRLAEQHQVAHQITWIERFLTEAELSAVITATDIVLLTYSRTFTSQSGILNVVAPFRKKLIVSDVGSSLTSVVKRFHLGVLITPDDRHALQEGISKTISQPPTNANWDDYLSYASWDKQVSMVLEVLK
jgi:glycosyltransferase involved in cell wall biosynthesis